MEDENISQENSQQQEVKEETERQISKAVHKAVSLKQQKIQAKIDRCNKEKKFLDEVSCNPWLRISSAEHDTTMPMMP